ncbi:MAG: pyridoxamine 5'-phosphate oxidase family protein [Nitrososphaerales archaeon]
MTPKFLATRSAGGGCADGEPNIVPLISLLPSGDEPDLLFFGNFLLRKSIANLEADHRVGILVITPELHGWRLRGEFVEFQRSGPYVERQISGSLLRYNAYTGVRNAGLIRVIEVEGSFAISKLRVVSDYALARLSGRGSVAQVGFALPLPVRKEFGQLQAVKVLAWVGPDGWPTTVPALSLQPAGSSVLVTWLSGDYPRPPHGGRVAGNILTYDAVSYQVKGTWADHGRSGALTVSEVYAGGPPYPGGRVA